MFYDTFSLSHTPLRSKIQDCSLKAHLARECWQFFEKTIPLCSQTLGFPIFENPGGHPRVPKRPQGTKRSVRELNNHIFYDAQWMPPSSLCNAITVFSSRCPEIAIPRERGEGEGRFASQNIWFWTRPRPKLTISCESGEADIHLRAACAQKLMDVNAKSCGFRNPNSQYTPPEPLQQKLVGIWIPMILTRVVVKHYEPVGMPTYHGFFNAIIIYHVVFVATQAVLFLLE